MLRELEVDFFRLLYAFSTALDLSDNGIKAHHIRVALISKSLAKRINLDSIRTSNLIYAAMVHDMGVSTLSDKKKLGAFKISSKEKHCLQGYRLLITSPLLKDMGNFILSHHDWYQGGNESGFIGEQIPLESRIIHLADRVDTLIDNSKFILEQKKEILGKIKSEKGKMFDPYLVDCLEEVAQKESFWLDLSNGQYEKILFWNSTNHTKRISIDDLLTISKPFAQVIDNKSRFTNLHSRLVTAITQKMTNLADFTPFKCKCMQAAAMLHDLGKMAISEEILEKPGPLNVEEINIIKSHTYYTYRILEMVKGFEEIKKWAAYHHECLNGAGYPFKVKENEISDESRIIAVSDIFSALIEDRPYRKGLNRPQVEKIILDKVAINHLDKKWVNLILENYSLMIRCKDSL